MADDTTTLSPYNAQVAYLKKLQDFTETPEYQAVQAALPGIKAAYKDDALLGIHVSALCEIMPRITWALGFLKPVAPAPIAPLMPAQGSEGASAQSEQPSS